MNRTIAARRGWRLLYTIRTNTTPDGKTVARINASEVELNVLAQKRFGRNYRNLTENQQVFLWEIRNGARA